MNFDLVQKDHGAVIREIKSKVLAMTAERKNIPKHLEKIFAPSDYWQDFCGYFNYMFELSEESFKKLRLHTYHLTADNYQTYYFGDAEHFRSAWRLDSLIKDLPPHLVLNEPDGGIGHRYPEGGRFVSYDTVRFQRYVNALHKYGILDELLEKGKEQRNFALEIGGGYGGLAHHLHALLPNTTYLLIDLPETLLFAAAYICQLNPTKKIYLYDKSDFSKILETSAASEYDFILIPNYQLFALDFLAFDLVMNISSFQEMKNEQVEAYLDFIRDRCTGVLFSSNSDANPLNQELSSLFEMLERRFELTEVTAPLKDNVKIRIKQLAKSLAVKLGLLGQDYKLGGSPRRSADFICRPLPKRST